MTRNPFAPRQSILLLGFAAFAVLAASPAGAAVEVTAQRGGVLEDAVAAGEFVYVGQGSTIVTLPSEPKGAVEPSVTPPLPGLVESLAIHGDVLFVGWTDVANLARIDLYSLADPARPRQVGPFDSPFGGDFEPGSLAVVGDTLYLSAGSDLVPIDLSASTPVLGTPATHLLSRGRVVPIGPDLLLVQGLSIVGAPACRIVDVASPLAPSAHGSFFCGSAVPLDPRFVVNLWSTSFEVWDLDDPLDPVQIAQVSGMGLRAGAVAERILAVAAGDSARIWDLIDPSNPVERGATAAPLADSLLALTTPDLERAAFLTDRAEMVTVDISDPDSPQLDDARDLPVGTHPFDLDALGSNLLLADETLGLRLLDQKFAVLADLGDLGLAPLRTVEVDGSRALVVDEAGVHLVDLAVPEAPVLLGSLALPDVVSAELDGEQGWALQSNVPPRVYSVDLSNPSSPQIFHSWNVSGDLQLRHLGDRLYGAGGSTFWIFDVQTLYLVPIGFYEECDARNARVEGFLAAISCAGGEVHLVDVTVPTSSTRLGTYDMPAGLDAASLHFEGDVLYLGYDGGVDRVDVSDPAQPQLIQRLEMGGTVSRLLAAPGGGVLAVADDGGVALLQESGVALTPQSLDKPSALRRRVD